MDSELDAIRHLPIRRRLRLWRKFLDLTLEEASQRTGVSLKTLSKVELYGGPSTRTAALIEAATDGLCPAKDWVPELEEAETKTA